MRNFIFISASAKRYNSGFNMAMISFAQCELPVKVHSASTVSVSSQMALMD